VDLQSTLRRWVGGWVGSVEPVAQISPLFYNIRLPEQAGAGAVSELAPVAYWLPTAPPHLLNGVDSAAILEHGACIPSATSSTPSTAKRGVSGAAAAHAASTGTATLPYWAPVEWPLANGPRLLRFRLRSGPSVDFTSAWAQSGSQAEGTQHDDLGAELVEEPVHEVRLRREAPSSTSHTISRVPVLLPSTSSRGARSGTGQLRCLPMAETSR
jgi:hypothetical protein